MSHWNADFLILEDISMRSSRTLMTWIRSNKNIPASVTWGCSSRLQMLQQLDDIEILRYYYIFWDISMRFSRTLMTWIRPSQSILRLEEVEEEDGVKLSGWNLGCDAVNAADMEESSVLTSVIRVLLVQTVSAEHRWLGFCSLAQFICSSFFCLTRCHLSKQSALRGKPAINW